MTAIDALLSQLNDVRQVAAVRVAIVDLIYEFLLHKEEPDAWEAAHLANAIGALSLNVHALQQPTTAWLRLCLDDLERALLPEVERHQPGVVSAAGRDRPTWTQLRDAIEAIAINIEHATMPSDIHH